MQTGAWQWLDQNIERKTIDVKVYTRIYRLHILEKINGSPTQYPRIVGTRSTYLVSYSIKP